MKFKTLLLLTTLIFTTTACCLFDYSEEIKEVAEPMLKNLETFYQKNKRFPTDKERDEMLLASGCKSVVGGVCEKDGREILLSSRKYSKPYEYVLDFKHDDTSCRLYQYIGRGHSSIFCDVKPCLRGISH
ncbi:MAG TPA: hypothetical protein ENJ34_04230 [Epsilonproteobacteria bacterium]|nr:hypothetical protein [Campylobacterota bacterium]